VTVLGEREGGYGRDVCLVDQRSGSRAVRPSYDAVGADLFGPHQVFLAEPVGRRSVHSDADRATRCSSLALVGLLRDDAIVEMPPFDLWLRGTEDIRQWLIAVNALADHLLTPVSANGSPAVAVYTPETPGGPPTAFAIHVLDVVDGRISAIHSFIDPSRGNSTPLPTTFTS